VAKLSLINRDIKRAKLAQKYAAKRAALKTVIADMSKTDEERYQARLQLQHHKLREMALRGEVPGITKASW